MANTRLYWLHLLSPTHVGAGRGVGYIDLPIHRDKVTHWPLIPGSAFKGVWSDYWVQQLLPDINADIDPRKLPDEHGRQLRCAFGTASDSDSDQSNSGSLVPTDARLVCLPIRSFSGTFAWCTSRLALEMLQRDLTLSGVKSLPDLPEDPGELTVLLASKADHKVLDESGRVYLEELDFEAARSPKVMEWAKRLAEWVFPSERDANWRERFVERFAVVPNSIFDYFTETGTEVTTRVRIDDNLKTVAEGQLWNEEALPAETILAGLISCERVYRRNGNGVAPADLLNTFATETITIQIGGKATVGRGRARCVFTPVAPVEGGGQ